MRNCGSNDILGCTFEYSLSGDLPYYIVAALVDQLGVQKNAAVLLEDYGVRDASALAMNPSP